MFSASNDSNFEELLYKWEEVYKKGLLTFWILLLLDERPAYPYEMSTEIQKLSQGTIVADDNSIYRALNRFEGMGIVEGEFQQSSSGPARKYYRLTIKGMQILAHFIQRNILIFETPEIAQRIQYLLNHTRMEEREI